MATKASTLLRSARKAALVSRAAAAAASRAAAMASCSVRLAGEAEDLAYRADPLSLDLVARAAAMASRSVRLAGVAEDIAYRAARLSWDLVNHHKCCSNSHLPINVDYYYLHIPTIDDFDHIPDDSKFPTDKDLESDEAVWALYERWCKAFDKKRDRAEMVRRFKIFRYNAEDAHSWNTDVSADPEEAAILVQKRREAKLLLAKGEDVSHLADYLPAMLGPLADGGDPYLRECDYNLLKDLENREARRAPKDVTVE